MSRPSTEHYDLTEAEKCDIIKCIETGKPLPERCRFLLFQTLEHIDESKSVGVSPTSSSFQPEHFDTSGRQSKGWADKLIWGDNKFIPSSRKSGALRRQIEDAGGLKLIDIDPPFDVGAGTRAEAQAHGRLPLTRQSNDLAHAALAAADRSPAIHRRDLQKGAQASRLCLLSKTMGVEGVLPGVVAVKVIDIFGNDTMALIAVSAG